MGFHSQAQQGRLNLRTADWEVQNLSGSSIRVPDRLVWVSAPELALEAHTALPLLSNTAMAAIILEAAVSLDLGSLVLFPRLNPQKTFP